MNELWKQIPNYENYYVSNYGDIKNINYRGTGKTRTIRGTINNGYVYVALRKDNKTKMCLLHRLVAQAFIPNLENKYCINHKDCDRQNNRVDNLEWCTLQENVEYMDKLNRRNPTKKITDVEVNKILKNKKEGMLYKDVWQKYKDKITLSGFEKIWYRATRKDIEGDETR